MNYDQRLMQFLINNRKLKLTVADIARIWKRSLVDVKASAKRLCKRNAAIINPRTGVISPL